MVFHKLQSVCFLEESGRISKVTDDPFSGDSNWHVKTTEKYIYYKTSTYSSIARCSTNLEIDILPMRFMVADFEVSSDDQITALSRTGALSHADQEIKIEATLNQTLQNFWRLKQMYSDHFLVARDDNLTNAISIHLVRKRPLEVVDSIQLPKHRSTPLGNIRLMAIRLKVEPILITQDRYIHLICNCQEKLFTWGQFESQKEYSINSLTWSRENTWIACLNYNKIVSIEVHFPEALKL